MKKSRLSVSVFTGFLLSLVFVMFSSEVKAQEGYIVIDRYSKRVLLAANSEQSIPVGNFSQVATAKIALDWAKLSGTPLSTMMPVSAGVANSGLGNVLSLQAGDFISMRDAIYTIALNQDRACSLVLADFVGNQLLTKRGKRGNPYTAFLKEMNNLAKHLNMSSTQFKSPAGGLGKTKVSDLARLAASAQATTGYDFYVKQKSRTISVQRSSGSTQKLKITNSNNLLGKNSISGLSVDGVNTVISVDKSNVVKKLADGRAEVTPRQLIIISYGSANKDARVLELISSGWQQYEGWRKQGFPISSTGKEFLR